MKLKLLTTMGLGGLALGIGLTVTLGAQLAPPIPPDRLRFRVVTDEQVANVDLRSAVAGWRVLVVKDTTTAQCYVTFVAAAMISKTDPIPCP